VGRRDASRIWGFMSKFAMLDRFSKTLGADNHYPGIRVPRKSCSREYLGTSSKVSTKLYNRLLYLSDLKILEGINPPTKVLERFLKTWGEREKTRAQYSTETAHLSSYNEKDPAGVTLALSRRLITVFKARNILNIEAGMDMVALAMAISSEVRLFFRSWHNFLSTNLIPSRRTTVSSRK